MCPLNADVCSQRCESPARLSSQVLLFKESWWLNALLCASLFCSCSQICFLFGATGWISASVPSTSSLSHSAQVGLALCSGTHRAGSQPNTGWLSSSQVYCPKSQLLTSLVDLKSLWKSLQLCTVICSPFQDMFPMESCLSWWSPPILLSHVFISVTPK